MDARIVSSDSVIVRAVHCSFSIPHFAVFLTLMMFLVNRAVLAFHAPGDKSIVFVSGS